MCKHPTRSEEGLPPESASGYRFIVVVGQQGSKRAEK
jgi:hypothetical protein